MTTSMTTDVSLLETVSEALRFNPSIDSTFIVVTTRDGAVTLAGDVESYPEKVRAERVAQRVRGVRVVIDDVSVRTTWGLATDEMIAAAANEALTRSLDVPDDTVRAGVHRRVVTLTGSTPWQYQRLACSRAVRDVQGVADVVNQVLVQPTFTPEGIHSAIAAALTRSAELEGEAIEVTAVGGEITLSGTVRTWGERHAAEATAWSAAGATHVRNHLVIDHAYNPPQLADTSVGT